MKREITRKQIEKLLKRADISSNYKYQDCSKCIFCRSYYYVEDNALFRTGHIECRNGNDIKENNHKGCWEYQEIIKPEFYHNKIELALALKSLDESLQFYIEEVDSVKQMATKMLKEKE